MHPLRPAIRSVVLLIAVGITWAQTRDQVSLYRVPLVCPAARNLGCGSAAKPVLLALEKKDTIQQAWLDHSGTTLAIVWKRSTTSDARAADLRSAWEGRNISLKELTGSERDETWKSFHSGKQWYRGAEVDKLSEEEAMVITERLVRRATAKEPTIASKAEKLKLDIAQVIRERITGCDSAECRANYRRKLEETARKDLTEAEFGALMEAAKLGYRPVGNEQ
jgi:predicted DNA binding protein